MTIITSNPLTTTEMLDARVSQAYGRLENQYLTMDPEDAAAWVQLGDLQQELVFATYGQGQNVLINHQLSKQILTSS